MLVIEEGVAPLDVAVDAADSEVHLAESPGGVVGLLAVDGDLALGLRAIAVAGGVRGDELQGLDEYAAGAAAGVKNTALVGFEHFDEEADDAGGRVELSAALAFLFCELAQEVLVDSPEHVALAAGLVAQADRGNQIDHLAEATLVERRAGVVLGENTLEGLVLAFEGGHRVVDERADLGALGVLLEVVPAGLGRHPRDVLGEVLVLVLGVGVLVSRERSMLLEECV